MAFPQVEAWNRDTADIIREDSKRKASPSSFFFSHGRSLCLAADYFNDDRLSESARGGVAIKHRHKLQLAIFGQLLAAFEYLLKDFVAKALDATNVFDEKIKDLDWLKVSTDRILYQRTVQSTVGSMLVHPTLGWHTPETVNERYREVFNVKPIEDEEIKTLLALWVLRHSVAHNAGFVTANDAARINQTSLSERVAQVDSQFIWESFGFLCGIAERIAERCGKSMLNQWLRSMEEFGPDYERDSETYTSIKLLGAYVDSRSRELPEFDEQEYLTDWEASNGT